MSKKIPLTLQTAFKRPGSFLWLIMLVLSCANARAQEQNAVSITVNVPKYNRIQVSPITALDVGFGVGASYERLLGANQEFGIILPAHFILENNGTGNDQYNGTNSPFNTYIYLTPGLKFYPSGHKKVTYAFGPSLMLGFGNKKTMEYIPAANYGASTEQVVKYARKRYGVLMNNYVTMDVGKYFELGLEGGLGFCYYDRESYNGSEFYPDKDLKKSIDLTGQFSLSLGYKF
jgi:hypothetical protein